MFSGSHKDTAIQYSAFYRHSENTTSCILIYKCVYIIHVCMYVSMYVCRPCIHVYDACVYVCMCMYVCALHVYLRMCVLELYRYHIIADYADTEYSRLLKQPIPIMRPIIGPIMRPITCAIRLVKLFVFKTETYYCNALFSKYLFERFNADESHRFGVIDCRWLRTNVPTVFNR